MRNRLGIDEWIEAGLETLAEGGIEAVRVEPLAAKLHVTKGSFYWHFQDRQGLLDALLQAWQVAATNNIITIVDTRGGDGQARLRTLFKIALASDGRLEHAIRTWARSDETAAQVVADIDRRRTAYVEALFRRMGFAEDVAAARARFVYLAVIGQYAMGPHGRLQAPPNQAFEAILHMLTEDV